MFVSSYLAKETGNVPSPASGLIAMDIEHGGVTWLIEEKCSTVVQRFSGTLSHTRLREDLPSLTVDAFSHFAFGQVTTHMSLLICKVGLMWFGYIRY